MSIGTLACWLFGHKFIGWNQSIDEKGNIISQPYQMRFCRRCGCDKPKDAKAGVGKEEVK